MSLFVENLEVRAILAGGSRKIKDFTEFTVDALFSIEERSRGFTRQDVFFGFGCLFDLIIVLSIGDFDSVSSSFEVCDQ